MEQIIVGSIIAFFVTFLVIPVIILIAQKKKLYDEPDDKRKLHNGPIPSLGGLGMFVGFILSILLTLNFSSQAPEFQFYVAAFFLIFFLGIKDDILVLSPQKKFLGQVIAAAILVYKAKLAITNMHGLFGIFEMNALWSFTLTVFSIVVITNAFNLIDGVDGLAGGLGLISTLVFGIYFLINGNIPYAVLGLSYSACLAAFLCYNLHPAKIFMGDTGSLMIGLVNSILVIKFIETGNTYSTFPVAAAPAVGFGVLLVPLMDTLRVFAVRIVNGRSPFSPDRNHIHHILLNKGFNHKNVTYTCVVSTVVITMLAFLFQKAGIHSLFIGLMALFFSAVYVLNYKKSKHGLRVVKGKVKATAPDNNVRLMPIFEEKAAVVDEEK